ncbi:transglycosylase SLT domain-containing protein [Jannaschia seohaensis]|uniref:Transglycosylase SLT domain-containing protein n=1 Tax=Jannaschia seohaensis TaxID=475081 RepID=A0A2Y9BZK1_9RHOB|nr:transglycosylase SLT domain-containing protein [Jannaschia seohaensis]PWJ20422.1 transglycosylase-like protein with SLT domain [Jannaschia seohaensis]SSA44502.1 Transglycosylase SLT domain-containing protein [Jannaschia seohaensis]
MTKRTVSPLKAAALVAFGCVLGTAAVAEPMPVPRTETLTVAAVSRLVDPSPAMSSAPAETIAPSMSARPVVRPAAAHAVAEELPDLRWDHVEGASRWTRAAMRAMDTHGQRLIETVPRDIAQWCPAYVDADRWGRKAFWAGLLSTLSKHESTYRPHAVGGGGLWYGLVQILPATARGYGCQARTGEALKNGELNMSCAVRILNVTVPRDGVVARGYRGVAADWGPFHSTRKREDMRRWLNRQPFCNGLHKSARPVERPDWLGDPAGEGMVVPMFVAWELDKEVLAPRGPLWPSFEVAAADG